MQLLQSTKHFPGAVYSEEISKINFIKDHMFSLFLLLHKLKKIKSTYFELCSIKHCFEGSTHECKRLSHSENNWMPQRLDFYFLCLCLLISTPVCLSLKSS